MKHIIPILLLFISTSFASAQNGTLTGKVQTNDGRNVAEAKVSVLGRTDTATTDYDGNYRLTLPAGKYMVYFDQERFGNFSDSVIIKDGQETFLNVILNIGKEIGTIGISVNRKPKGNTTEWAVQQKKISANFVEAIGAQEIGKTTAINTGDVLKRIPGTTIMEGKFANIRGMFDRYNAGFLNGAPLPSTESDRKAFSFDIIPASLLDNIVVIKSGTPDMIGDFGGGIIRINTKSIPDKLTQSFNLGFQYNSITTFREVQEFPSSTSEYFGFSGSNRKLPNLSGDLNSGRTSEFLGKESQKFNNDWTLRTSKPMPAPRFNYSIGVPFKLKKGREIGLLMSVNYSLTQKYSDGNVNRNDLGDNRVLSTMNDKLFTNSVQNGGLANISFKINNRNRLDWRNLYTINYGTSSTLRSGLSSSDDGVYMEAYSNMVTSNRLASTQLNGTHILGKKQTTLTWMMNYGNTHREIPDFRIAQYAIIDGVRTLSLNDFFNSGSGRFFSDLTEKTRNGSVDMLHTFKTKKITTNVKYGIFYQQRNRVFTSRNFVYGPTDQQITSNKMPEQDFGNSAMSAAKNFFLIEKTSSDKDEYNGVSNLYATYAMLENHMPLFYRGGKAQELKVIYGVRFERFSQILRNEYFSKYLHRYLSNPGTTNDFLPSINIISPVSAKSSLRFAYYKTVNRPEMRELAPFAFYNFNINSEILGNTQLKRAQLHNFDVRYEIFSGKEDMISIGAFAKKIINPIEFSLDVTQPSIRTFNYQNGKSAEINGIELEVRKNMGFVSESFASGFFKNLSFYGNFSLIKSKVQFSGNTSAIQNRPLQGQSPYVANVSFFYESKSGVQFNTSFNKIGPRIAYIGVAKDVQPYGSDIYEFGRSIFDMQIGKKFKKAGTLKLTWGDILHQNTAFYQDLNHNGKYDVKTDNTLFKFTTGSTVTISYGYTF